MKKFRTFAESYKYLIKNYPNNSCIECFDSVQKIKSVKNRFFDVIPILNIDAISYIKGICQKIPYVTGRLGNKSFTLEKCKVEIGRINEFFYNKLLENIICSSNRADRNIPVTFDLDTMVGIDGLIDSDYPFLMMNQKMFSIILDNPTNFHNVGILKHSNNVIFGNYCHTPIYINNFVEDNTIIGGAFDDIVIGIWEDLTVQDEKSDDCCQNELFSQNGWRTCLNMDICITGDNVYKFSVIENRFLSGT